MSASKFADVPTIPMELELPPPVETKVKTPRTTEGKSVEWARCPMHAAPGNTGLVMQNGHLVWRHHEVHTIGGAKFECRASGVRLCDLPDRLEHEDCPCSDGIRRAAP